ncbi:hypothetical protein QN277_010054 [Acacia crassicarpa]|uniref:Uncharacterized protein n=1 Tax=Acacia crassicarpa TaxID=499986 RepID=A0AAE1IS47_9FABA|nr:hypothetical protein QN277_010054 [Acacia crassicarpa]
MERGGYGRGRSGHYRGGPRGRNGGRSAGGPPLGGVRRGFRHRSQPHDDRSWGDDTRRGGYGRGGFDRGGRGRGSGRNAAVSSVWKAFLSSQSPNSASDPVTEIENLQISPKIFPIPRPDGGCTCTVEIQTSKLRVNHFPVRFNPDDMLMHYNFDVNPTPQVTSDPTSPVTADPTSPVTASFPPPPSANEDNNFKLHENRKDIMFFV